MVTLLNFVKLVFVRLCLTLIEIVWLCKTLLDFVLHCETLFYSFILCLTLLDFVWLSLNYVAMHTFCTCFTLKRLLFVNCRSFYIRKRPCFLFPFPPIYFLKILSSIHQCHIFQSFPYYLLNFYLISTQSECCKSYPVHFYS